MRAPQQEASPPSPPSSLNNRPQPFTLNLTPHTAKNEALNPKPLGIQSRVKALRSSATDRMTGVTLHGVVFPENSGGGQAGRHPRGIQRAWHSFPRA